MRPQTIGRVLGIGVRIAGRTAGQLIAGQMQSGAQSPAPARTPTARVGGPAVRSRAAGQAAGNLATQTRLNFGQGIGGFLRPFRRVGGILWLEVTGVFFLLPVIVFAPTLWRAGVAYPHTGDHRTFWVTAFVVTVFLYLGVSSFWRARRR